MSIKEKVARKKVGPSMSLKSRLDMFKTLTLYLADHCMGPIDRLVFNASRAPTRRLSEIAILLKSVSNFTASALMIVYK